MTYRASPQRLLRTVLFTDIVDSTGMAARLGDERWRALLVRHHEAIRRELKRHRGREMDTAGDGFFATFESPTDGVRCAAAAVATVHGLGLRIRAGLHTGEVESSDGKATGIAVHIAARLMSMAGPEEVLVSGTLHDLVAGSGQEFTDRGSHELKGVPGAWRVWALDLPPLDAAVVEAAHEEARITATSRRRERALLVGSAGLLMLVLIGIGYIWLAPDPTEPVVGGPDRLMAFATSDGSASSAVETGRGPTAIEAMDEAIWVANIDSGTLTRIDPTSGATATVGQVSSRPSRLTVANEHLIVADRYSDQITLLDARTGQLQGRVDLHASAIDAGEGAVWATDDLFDLVRRLDPRTGAESASFALPAGSGPTDVDASAVDRIWIAAAGIDALLALDPPGEEIVERVDITGIERISRAGNDLWAVSPSLDTVTRVDIAGPRTAVSATVCDNPVAVEAIPDGGGAWIACSVERALWRVDHAGNSDVKVELEAVPTDVALVGDRVLVTLRED